MLFSADNITKAYEENNIVENVSLSINKGETVALIGKSGVGKSTLFNIFAGLLNPNSGKIILNDKDITNKTGNVGYMLQKDLLMPYKTIIKNVCLPLKLKGIKDKDAQNTALSYFEMFGLSGYENKYPDTLSGGMRRRAALLRTFLTGSPMILLDEPFSALDSITRKEIWSWYQDISKKNSLSTLFITHDILEAKTYADKIFILSGSPSTITKTILPTYYNKITDNEIFSLL